MQHCHERLAPGIVWCEHEGTIAVYPDQTGRPDVVEHCKTEPGQMEILRAVWEWFLLIRPDIRRSCVRLCIMEPRESDDVGNFYRMGTSAYPLINAPEIN